MQMWAIFLKRARMRMSATHCKSATYKPIAWNSLPVEVEAESNYNSYMCKLSKYDLDTMDFIPYIKNKKLDYIYYK